MNLTKKGYVIINYWQCLKSKMFWLEYDITLLFVHYMSFLRCEVWAMKQHIRFLLLGFKVICDDRLKWRQGQCPFSLASIQNMSYHKILQVLMVWIHNDFMLNSFKQMMPLLKGIHDIHNTRRKRPICDQCIYNYLWLFGFAIKILPLATNVTSC